MPRVKRSGARAQEAPQGPGAGEGVLGPQELPLHVREGAGRALARLRLPRPQEQEAHVPASSGSSGSTPRRGSTACRTTSSSPACTRPGSSSTASRSPTSRSRTRRRSPRSPSRQRPRSRPRQPEPSQGSRLSLDERQADVFRRQAEHFSLLGSPVYGRLAAASRRGSAGRARPILGDDASWDLGLRLFGAVHHHVLTGAAPRRSPASGRTSRRRSKRTRLRCAGS